MRYPADNCSESHTVVSGDTCIKIASAAGISLDEFWALNPSINHTCVGLTAGQVVCIKPPPSSNFGGGGGGGLWHPAYLWHSGELPGAALVSCSID